MAITGVGGVDMSWKSYLGAASGSDHPGSVPRPFRLRPAGGGRAAGSLDGVPEDTTHLTRATYERLQAELEDLTTRGRVDIARAIEAARALGDLSENGDYHAAKDSQGKMEARIRQIRATLAGATVVEEGTSQSPGTVSAGSVVAIRYEGDDDVERFLVGSIEERHDELNVVSPGSPLGQALLGKSRGEVIEYQAPGGTLRVEIVEVSGRELR
jgi:transcription elongation factor GreA